MAMVSAAKEINRGVQGMCAQGVVVGAQGRPLEGGEVH